MTDILVACLEREPTAELLANTVLRVLPGIDISVFEQIHAVQLTDQRGQVIAALDLDHLARIPTELPRLFGDDPDVPSGPVWWVEAHMKARPEQSAGSAAHPVGRLLEELAASCGGTVHAQS